MAIALFVPAAVAETDPLGVPEVLLKQFKQRMAERLARLPGYTCAVIVERLVRKAGAPRLEPRDTLQLEVAFVGGKELYTRPDAARFEEKPVEDVVGAPGAIGSGAFALHARALFLTDAAEFTYAGRAARVGPGAARFNFRIPAARSEFVIHDGVHARTVAYKGSVFIDPESLDLVRLDIRVDEIPPAIRVSSATDTTTYGRVRIGEADFLLPQASEVTVVSRSGTLNQNRARFEACRQYVGQSVVSYTRE